MLGRCGRSSGSYDNFCAAKSIHARLGICYFWGAMLDAKVTELADRFIRLQFDEQGKQLNREIAKTRDEARLKGGMGTSSVVVELVRGHCARDIELRALIVWHNLQKVLSRSGVILSETLADDLKQEVAKYAEAIFLEPFNCFQAVVQKVGIGRTAQPLTEARDKALEKVSAEIDLFVLGLQGQQDARGSQAAPVYNFYSPVGAVQTGQDASAQVFQNLSTQDRDAFLGAIDALREGLAGIDRLPAHPKQEIVELVEEAEAETKKARPNSSKLLSTFTAISQAVQTVGSLQPAYNTLKAALIPFGIHLP